MRPWVVVLCRVGKILMQRWTIYFAIIRGQALQNVHACFYCNYAVYNSRTVTSTLRNPFKSR